MLCVGEGDDIVAQLAVGDAAFWVAAAEPGLKRLSPLAIEGATGRTLQVVDDPDAVVEHAVKTGATETAAVVEENGWRLGRIVDPFGHEWEIGRPAALARRPAALSVDCRKTMAEWHRGDHVVR